MISAMFFLGGRMMVTTLPDTLAVSSLWKSFLRRKTSMEWSTDLFYILVELLYQVD